MVVVMRFRAVDVSFGERLEQLRARLAACRGYESGVVGRNVDDPELWALVTQWADTGSYRRALSTYEVKLHAVPTMSQALEEPTAYETGSGGFNEPAARTVFD